MACLGHSSSLFAVVESFDFNQQFRTKVSNLEEKICFSLKMAVDFGLIVDFIDLPGSYSKRVHYSQLIGQRFPRRHFVKNFSQAFRTYQNSSEKVYIRSFFIVRPDTCFYQVSDDFLISAEPLLRINFMPGKREENKARKFSSYSFIHSKKKCYCIWQRSEDHYNRRLIDYYNENFSKVDPATIKDIKKETT